MTDKIFQKLDEWKGSRPGVLLFYGYLVAIFITGALAVTAIHRNTVTSKEAKMGLCSLQSERQNRVAQVGFLLNNPEDPQSRAAIKSHGLPLLQKFYETAKSDLEALKGVDCPEGVNKQ